MVLPYSIVELVYQALGDQVRIVEQHNPGDWSVGLRVKIGQRTHLRGLAARRADQPLAA